MELDELKQKVERLYDECSPENLDQAKNNYLEVLNYFSLEHNELFITLLCQKLLGKDLPFEIEGELIEFKFVDRKIEGTKENIGKWTYFSYLAQQVLLAIENPIADDDKPKTGVITVAEFLGYDLRTQLRMPFTYKKYESVFFHEIVTEFFSPLQECLENFIYCYVHDVYSGVPVYKKDASKNNLYLLNDADKDYVYLIERGRNEDTVSSPNMPEWAKRCYVNLEHIYKFYNFDNSDYEPSDKERKILFSTFRKLINVQSTEVKEGNFGTETKLYKIMQIVLSRYYGDTFDINDNDTWTRQKDIVDWLMNHHDLSKREAEAIDLVTRPDAARNK